MYSLTVRNRFTAFLNLAPSGEDESYDIYHNYLIEVEVSGLNLDEQGFLMNIDDLDEWLAELVNRWDGELLNELDEFLDLNPTLEVVAHAACESLAETLRDSNLAELRVTLWENEIDPYPGPGASCRMALA